MAELRLYLNDERTTAGTLRQVFDLLRSKDVWFTYYPGDNLVLIDTDKQLSTKPKSKLPGQTKPLIPCTLDDCQTCEDGGKLSTEGPSCPQMEELLRMFRPVCQSSDNCQTCDKIECQFKWQQ